MTKRILSGLTCLLLANSVFALSQSSNLPFQGAYIQGSLGIINANYKFPQQTSALLDGGLEEAQTSSSSNYNYANDVMASLALGYNQIFSNYVLGLVAKASLTNAQVSTNINVNSSGDHPELPHEILNTNIKVTFKDNYSLLIKPGILLDNTTLLYFLLGPTWGYYKVSDQASFSHSILVTPPGTVYGINGATSSSSSGYKLGVTAGIGIEKYLSQKVGIGVEYDYAYFGHLASIASTGNITTAAPGLGTIGTIHSQLNHVTLQTNAFMFNVFYNFS